MSWGVGCRLGSDPALLWLWCRLAAAALIRPLGWEPPYAAGAALEKAKRQKIIIIIIIKFKKRKECEKEHTHIYIFCMYVYIYIYVLCMYVYVCVYKCILYTHTHIYVLLVVLVSDVQLNHFTVHLKLTQHC